LGQAGVQRRAGVATFGSIAWANAPHLISPKEPTEYTDAFLGSRVTMIPKPVVTYDFDGVKHVQQGHSFRAVSGEECEMFQTLQELERQHDWPAVRDLCETQIEKTPEWLTPYLCAGVACANLGRRKEAIRRLEHVEKATAGNPLYAAATRILNQLRREAAGPPAKAESVH
jgi:hypothetical protein